MRKYPTNSLSRYVGLPELCSYTHMGRNTALKFAKDADAVVRYGRSLRYDLHRIDAAMEACRISATSEGNGTN